MGGWRGWRGQRGMGWDGMVVVVVALEARCLRTADDTAETRPGSAQCPVGLVQNSGCPQRTATDGEWDGGWPTGPASRDPGAIQAHRVARSAEDGSSSASRQVGGEGRITGCAAVGACIGGGQALHLSNKRIHFALNFPLRRRLPAPCLPCSGFLASAQPERLSSHRLLHPDRLASPGTPLQLSATLKEVCLMLVARFLVRFLADSL